MTNEATEKARPGRKPRRSAESYDTSTVSGRLRYARSRMFPSASAAARANGWVISTTTQHESGERQLTTEAAIKYAHVYEVSLDYLFLGKTTDLLNFSHNATLRSQFTSIMDLGDIEALRKYAVGKRAMSGDLTIFVKMPDKSMETPIDPRSIREGEQVECNASEPWGPGDIVLAVVEGLPAALVREFAQIADTMEIFELRPLNPAFATIRVGGARPGMVIAKATGALRRF